MSNYNKLKKTLPYVLAAALVAFPLFGNLNTSPVRIWDESRNIINAYEMHKNHNWIVTYCEDSPDLWNTKPPLLIWLQVFFINLIGFGELAVRLPSAIAAFLTCAVLLIFSVKYLKDFMFGFVTVMVIICCHGYTDPHVARNGDYDSLLILFTTLGSLLFFAHLETKRNKFLYLFFIAMSLGVLTKSVSALLFSPALILYALWQKQLLNLLKNKHFYFSTMLFLVIVFGYYFLREHASPGYLAAVQKNELGGRFMDTIELHNEGFWFYYINLLDRRISDWYYFIPAGFAVGLLSTNSKIRKLTVFSTLLIVVFFLVISTAQTKLFWYDAPMLPFIAIITAALIDVVYNTLKKIDYLKNNLRYNIFPYIFLFVIFITPYRSVFMKTYESTDSSWDVEYYRISHYLRTAIKNPAMVDKYTLLYRNGKPAQLFMYEKLLQEKSVDFEIKNINTAKAGDLVIVSEQQTKDQLTDKFEVEVIETHYNITKYKLIRLKNIS